jgi:hypothetical protein
MTQATESTPGRGRRDPPAESPDARVLDAFDASDLRALLTQPRPPCVSLFLPTRRGGDERGPRLLKNLLGEAEERLTVRGLRRPTARGLLAPARRLLTDEAFWKRQADGLSLFLADGFVRAYRLPTAFEPLAAVAQQAHVRPLLPLLSGDGRFFVLALSQKRVRLLQGTRNGVEEIDARGLPRNLEEALRFHDRDEPLLFHTHPVLGLGRWGAIFHGHGVGIDDVKDDLLLYFRRIDRGLHDWLRDERAPLVLASVDYLWPLYRKANTYPHLSDGGVAGNPDRLSPRELHDRAWPLVEPLFQEGRRKATVSYERLAGTGRTTDRLEEVIAAADQGRVETLFVAPGQGPWGAFDADSGATAVHEPPLPGDEDLVNRAAVGVLRHGGAVYVVAPDEAPAGARLPTALYRSHDSGWKPTP